MKPGLQFRLHQQLTLTPQLQQAIRLLQLSQLELEAELRQIAESNPLLEFAEDAEFERFCRKNHNYLIYEVGGRIAPRERIQFLKEFVMAADMPDDHTARSHKRERDAYLQQMKPEAEDEDDEDNDEPYDQD